MDSKLIARPVDPLVCTYMHVNSARRPSPTTSASNPFPCKLSAPINSVVAIELLTANIPKTFYNVSAALGNNLFYWSDGTGPYITTVPDGFYSATSLLSYLQTQLNIFSSNYLVTVSATTGRVTISNSSFNFSLDGTRPNTILPLLGFLLPTYTGAMSYTGTIVLNLDLPYNLFVTCSQAGSSASTTGLLTGFNWAISVAEGTPGSIVSWKQGQEYQSRVTISKTNFSALNFTLTDDNGNAINLNGGDWDMLIRCWSEPSGSVRAGIPLPFA